MRPPIDPNELFVEAVVQMVDIETVTGIVKKVENGEIKEFVDIYGFNEMRFVEETFFVPKYLDFFVLNKFGFEEKEGKYFLDYQHGQIEIYGKVENWTLVDGGNKTPIVYAHHLQLKVKELFGIDLIVQPDFDEEEDEDE